MIGPPWSVPSLATVFPGGVVRVGSLHNLYDAGGLAIFKAAEKYPQDVIGVWRHMGRLSRGMRVLIIVDHQCRCGAITGIRNTCTSAMR